MSRFDGELAKSTMAALAFFLVGLPLLTALDGELGKSTMGVEWAIGFEWVVSFVLSFMRMGAGFVEQ